MIRSMTAFARMDNQLPLGEFVWEIRSVNHRHLEISLRLPEELRPIEPAIREMVATHIRRGKLDCTLRFKAGTDESRPFTVNKTLVEQLTQASHEVDQVLNNPAPVNAMDILRWPGVLESAELDREQIQATAMSLLDRALADLVSARAREGEKLKGIIQQRLNAMLPLVAQTRKDMPAIVKAQHEKLQTRLAELKVEVDKARLEQELAMMAQKVDVAEELDRLDAHLKEVQDVLERDEPVGRRLDFLMQELNREANTLGSKSISTSTTGASVELKVLIEQMREQVQNIE